MPKPPDHSLAADHTSDVKLTAHSLSQLTVQNALQFGHTLWRSGAIFLPVTRKVQNLYMHFIEDSVQSVTYLFYVTDKP